MQIVIDLPQIFMWPIMKTELRVKEAQKTQGFCITDFATLSDERKSRSEMVLPGVPIKTLTV